MTPTRIVPEVVQTSAMDCGPACLAALLAGYRVDANYDRLRDACQTDVDGTSIDTIEEAAVQLGLHAEQILVPVDHVLAALPAIAVTRQPDGNNHFVVLWSAGRQRVQVMDPAVGRRWIPIKHLLADLYVHEMQLAADTWREWAGSDDMRVPLAERLATLGIGDALIDTAVADPSWRSIAALDAATRTVQRIVDVKTLRAGADAAAAVGTLVADPAAIPSDAWSARPSDDPTTLRVRGAILVKVSGHTPTRPKSAELQAALDQPAARPWRDLHAAVVAGGRVVPFAIAAAAVVAAVLLVVEAALWRSLFDTPELTTLQITGAIAILVVFLAIELLVEASLVGAILRLGRRVEVGLRIRFLASIGRLGLPYLRSRPISDMAERSHALYRLRELPLLAARIARHLLVVLVTATALIWLTPGASWLVVLLAAAVIVPPLLAHRGLVERELRVRTHHGALSRFYFDALLGVIPARVHGVERALRREHESRLVEWVRAAWREHALASGIAAVQTTLAIALAAALVAAHADGTDRPASLLLLIYWTVGMTTTGAAFASSLREIPQYRNLTLRLLQPISAHRGSAPVITSASRPDAALTFAGVSVIAGGHTILEGIDVSIAHGEQVAIVGRSGSGKSTLLGLLLGWHRPATGAIEIGGEPLDDAAIATLRRRTAWVDPSVQLWNDSLAANLAFGATATPDLGANVLAAQLDGVLARLPEGMQTQLGEGGGLVSGGEGQRIRFGRALARDDVALVVLDEPFRGIDRERRRELLGAARARWKGATVLCATHDLRETLEFDRILVVEDGKIVEDGTPADLAARASSRYTALLAEEKLVAEVWSRWRRVRLDRGTMTEEP